MKYLILFFALNVNAQTVITLDAPTTPIDQFSDYVCADEKCKRKDEKIEIACDQEELDRLTAEIGAYEITCEELEEL